MIVRRIYLQNYRVYEGVHELEVPDGLVGIYGPNGAGKSYLIESIPWALYGYGRGAAEEGRTTGVNDECVVEITFEHEGHEYVVRRTITGGGKTIKRDALVMANGMQVATGARDVERYVQQLIGMNEKGFLASVFAEQKQLAALSSQTPGERRKLVLDLLGITPIESAVKAARRDAKSASDTLASLQTVVADLGALETERDDAAARAVAARADAEIAVAAAMVAREQAEAARDKHEAMARQLEVGRQLAQRHAELVAAVERLQTESDALATADATLAALGDTAALLAMARTEFDAVRALGEARERHEKAAAALATLAGATEDDEPPYPSDATAVAARGVAAEAQRVHAGLEATARARAEAVKAAEASLQKADDLDADADCPTCGQELGDSFEQVRAHRTEEAVAARAALAEAKKELAVAAKVVDTTARAAERAEKALVAARQAWERDQKLRAARQESLAGVRAAEEMLTAALATCDALRTGLRDLDAPSAKAALTEAEANHNTASELRGRLGRADVVRAELADATAKAAEVGTELDALRAEAKAAGVSPKNVEAAKAEREQAAAAAQAADKASREASDTASRAEAHATATATNYERAVEQHARIEPQAAEARLLGRLGELLNAFKDHEAAAVGPRLAGHARALFDDMTEGTYNGLELTDNFEVRLTDANRTFDLKRFSGSEVDLANLALRIAISECVTLQSGGAVGLLVLDEVFGPLDASRRLRLLSALNGLQTRFPQILVVTHADDVKAQLPSSIEVRVTGERRATAVVV